MSERWRESRKQFDREEAAKQQAKADQKAKAFWSKKWNEIAHVDMGDEAAFDDIGLPSREGGRDLTVEDGYRLGEDFNIALLKKGFELQEAGIRKFKAYLAVQHHHGRALTANGLMRCFSRLHNELGAFGEREISFDANKVQAEPPVPETDSRVSLDAIDNQPDTREGDRKAREIANAHYWTTEGREMLNQWKQHLYRDYGFIPTEEQQKCVIDFFVANNLSFLKHENWNRARRWAVRTGLFRSDMLTADEKLSASIEATDLSNLAHDEQIRLKHSIRQIHGQPFRD